MASSHSFLYDDDYYYTPQYRCSSPYRYIYPPAPARGVGGFFPSAGYDDSCIYQYDPASARTTSSFFPATEGVDVYYQRTPARRTGKVEQAAAVAGGRPKSESSRSASDPFHHYPYEPEPVRDRMTVKRAPSAEAAAAARLQAAARGFLARRAVRALRMVERKAEEVAEKVTREAEALRGDARARIAVGEALMRLLLQLDAVRGVRDYRRRVTRRVLALQDSVDALEVPAAQELASEELADGDRAAADEPCAVDETEQAADGANHGEDVSGNNTDAEGEWELVTEAPPEPVPEVEASAEEPPRQEPAGEAEEAVRCPDGGVNMKRLMEMVTVLCERSEQQCAVIGALADRVDTLERTVRRVEDAERKRRRDKKLSKEGKGTITSSTTAIEEQSRKQ